MKKIFSVLLAVITVISVSAQSLCVSALDDFYFLYDDFFDDIIEEPAEEEAPAAAEPVRTAALEAYQAESGEITLLFGGNKDTVKFIVYIYDETKKKYCIHETVKVNENSYYGEWAYHIYYIKNVKPSKKYKILVRQFDKDGEILFSEKASVTTREADPVLTVSTVTKPTIKWKASDDRATGYEVYVKKESAEKFNPNRTYRDSTLKEIKKEGFKLLCKSDKESSGSTRLKTTDDYTVIFRTFYKNKKGKKVYSSFSKASNTGDISAYINGLTLAPKAVCTGDELELVKKYVNETVTANMSNYEKLYAIFELVNSHGNYQDDIYKIDGNRPVWQIMEKQEGQCASWAYCLDAMLEYAGFDIKVVRGLRSSGQQHFWCQIQVNGQWYDLDAHLGSFLWGPYHEDYRGYVIADRA